MHVLVPARRLSVGVALLLLCLSSAAPGLAAVAAAPVPDRDGAVLDVGSTDAIGTPSGKQKPKPDLPKPDPQPKGKRYDSRAVSAPGPLKLRVGGESKPYVISFQNTGQTAWSTESGFHLRNVSTGNRFDMGRPYPSGCDGLPRRQTCSWTITAIAGDEPGPRRFVFAYRMYRDDRPFGETIKVVFKVRP